MYEKIEIGKYVIHTYNVFLLFAFIFGALLFEKQLSKFKINEKISLYLRISIPILIVLGLLGASVLEIITQNKPIRLINFNSGFTFYGGIITGIILICIYGKIIKLSPFFILNFYTSPLVLGHAIGRIGCFFAGCCYGKPTHSILGIHFPVGSLPYQEYGECAIHPTQLYESLFLWTLFILLQKINLEKRFPFYCIGYGIFRFLVEYLRADPRGLLFNLNIISPSQLISIFMIVVGTIIIIKQA